MIKKLDLNNFNAKDKFENLLNDNIKEIELSLPKSYDILLKQIKSLITTLIFFKRRRQISSFQKIRDSIQDETKHSFTHQTLGRLLKILPEKSIGVSWQNDFRKRSQLTLHINLLCDPDINVWIKHSKEFLLKIVHQKHYEFLTKNNIKYPKIFHYWHSSFKIDELPEIEPIDLPQPKIDNSQKDILSSMTFKGEIEKEESISAVIQNPDQENQLNRIPKVCQGLRSYAPILKIVQAKENFVAEAVEVAKSRKNLLLIELADILNSYFQRGNKGTHPLNSIYTIIKSSTSFKLMKDDEISEYISNLCLKSNGFFSKFHSIETDYIKCDKSKSYNQIRGVLYNSIIN